MISSFSSSLLYRFLSIAVDSLFVFIFWRKIMKKWLLLSLVLTVCFLPCSGQGVTVEVLDTCEPIPEEGPIAPIDLLQGSSLRMGGGGGGGAASGPANTQSGYWRFSGLTRDWFDGNDWRQLVREVKTDNYSRVDIKGTMTLQGTVQSKVEASIGVSGVVSAGISFEETKSITTTQEYTVPARSQAILRLEAVMYTCTFNETYYLLGVALASQEGRAYMAKGDRYTYATGPLRG
jgi:hypothetical protein